MTDVSDASPSASLLDAGASGADAAGDVAVGVGAIGDAGLGRVVMAGSTAHLKAPLLHRFRRPWLWVGGWVAMIATVAVGSLMSASHLPPPPFHGVDKLEHVVGYALLSGYAAMLFGRLRPRALAAAGLVGYGIGIEFAQAALTTTRMADPADMVANTVGVLLGLLFAATPAARWLQRLDGRLG